MAVKRVVIVGGGIAGLAAAHRLRCLAAQQTIEAAITLVESESRLGGKIVTERVDDFVIEGGPDSFLASKPQALALCQALGLGERLHGTNEKNRRTYVMRAGRLYELPEGLTGLIPSRLGPMVKTGLISPLGKLRLGLDYFIPPRPDDGDETLAAFVERRLGHETYARLIEPLLGGIYAGDGRQLSLAATFPQLRQTELAHGGLIKGMRATKRNASSGKKDHAQRRSAFLSLSGGLAELVEALTAALNGIDVRLGTRVTRIGVEGSGYSVTFDRGEALHADAIVLATPAYVSADLVAEIDPRLAETLRAIPYVSTATVSLAYRVSDLPRALDGYGYIVPRAEGRPIIACTWTSTKFPQRAPEGHGLIRAFIGRAGQEDALAGTDQYLLNLVQAELRAVLGITASPLFSRIFRWPKAMPQYTLGHLDRLETINQHLIDRPGLLIAGCAYRGVGIPDCIASGEVAAEKAIGLLKSALS